MVKVPSLYDKSFLRTKMSRNLCQKRVIRDTFFETFFSLKNNPTSTSTHSTNQISDICYGHGGVTITRFFRKGEIILLLKIEFVHRVSLVIPGWCGISVSSFKKIGRSTFAQWTAEEKKNNQKKYSKVFPMERGKTLIN